MSKQQLACPPCLIYQCTDARGCTAFETVTSSLSKGSVFMRPHKNAKVAFSKVKTSHSGDRFQVVTFSVSVFAGYV